MICDEIIYIFQNEMNDTLSDIPQNFGIMLDISKKLFCSSAQRTTTDEYNFYRHYVLKLLKKSNIFSFEKDYISLIKNFMFRDEDCGTLTIKAVKKYWPYRNWKCEAFFLQILSVTAQCLNDRGCLDKEILESVIKILYIPIHSSKEQLLRAVDEFCDDWFNDIISSYPEMKEKLVNEMNKRNININKSYGEQYYLTPIISFD